MTPACTSPCPWVLSGWLHTMAPEPVPCCTATLQCTLFLSSHTVHSLWARTASLTSRALPCSSLWCCPCVFVGLIWKGPQSTSPASFPFHCGVWVGECGRDMPKISQRMSQLCWGHLNLVLEDIPNAYPLRSCSIHPDFRQYVLKVSGIYYPKICHFSIRMILSWRQVWTSRSKQNSLPSPYLPIIRA